MFYWQATADLEVKVSKERALRLHAIGEQVRPNPNRSYKMFPDELEDPLGDEEETDDDEEETE